MPSLRRNATGIAEGEGIVHGVSVPSKLLKGRKSPKCGLRRIGIFAMDAIGQGVTLLVTPIRSVLAATAGQYLSRQVGRNTFPFPAGAPLPGNRVVVDQRGRPSKRA